MCGQTGVHRPASALAGLLEFAAGDRALIPVFAGMGAAGPSTIVTLAFIINACAEAQWGA
jgi:hypothetical protein